MAMLETKERKVHHLNVDVDVKLQREKERRIISLCVSYVFAMTVTTTAPN